MGSRRRLGFGVVGIALALSACGSASVTQNALSAPNQVQPLPGSATLNWTPVTQNTDGTILLDLAGYAIHYGSTASAMDLIIELPDPSETTYVVTNLSAGTWYFSVAAYTSNGAQGVPSNVASKTIN
jgi:hypothetical protein